MASTWGRLFPAASALLFAAGALAASHSQTVTTATQVMTGDNGAAVTIPPGTTVQYPPKGPREIRIATPDTAVRDSELPPGKDALPIVREFDPDGATFDPPIEITLRYTDDEIAGLDESTLTPYLFNEISGVFDIPIPSENIVARDLDNNSVTFRVNSFSAYGLAGSAPTDETPIASRWICGAVGLVLGSFGVLILFRRPGGDSLSDT